MVRGRGYGRGGGGFRGGSSYRGSGSSYRSGSGRSGGFGSSGYTGSRGSYGSSSYPYDSRNRDRMSSRHNDRHEDHKRSYRPSSRDRSSPERKRSRHEDSRPSSSYSSYHRRNDSSRSRQTPPPPPPSGRPSSGYRGRDESSSHRHSGASDSMGPPKSLPPRSGGRVVRSRGGGSSRLRGGSSRGIRVVRRRDATDVRIMRKKLLLAKQRDRARRIKIAKLTSSLRKRRDGPRKAIRKARTEKKDGESKDDDDEDEEKDKSKEEGDENDDGEKGEETESKDGTKKSKEGKDAEDDDEEGSEDEAVGDKEDDADDKDADDTKKSSKTRKPNKTFIKLTCVHCHMKYLTFKEYSSHLFSRTHKVAMRRLSLRQKAQLAHMRLTQRNAQREIEESSKDELEDCKPQFCLLCRLNYRQPKAKHQVSEAHRSMKKFLMPYCSTCHIAFKSPMVYETHRCSLEHIKRKARNNESMSSESSADEKEVDLTNFLTVDSVGEIDETGGGEKVEGEEGKEKPNVGAEHVKKMEVLYCDICRFYYQIKEDEDAIIKKHCATRSHLKSFMRYKQDQSLRLEAERLQRRKEAKEKKKESGEKSSEKSKSKTENGDDNEETVEDKLWEDVDKDLGDLLREVGPEGHEDDEEDGSVLNINIERYDRFKNSEKQKKELNGNGTADGGEVKKDEKSAEILTPAKIKKENETKVVAVKSEEKTVEAK